VAATVLLDVPTNVFVGCLMALSCYRQIARETDPFNRWFWRAMGYSVLVFIPVAGYFYYAYPDWSWVYCFETRKLPFFVGPLVLSAYGAGMFFGFLTAQAMIQRNMLRQAIALMVYALALTLGIFGFTHHQYLHLGTYDAYHAGKAVPFLQDSTFVMVINVGGALMVLAAAVILVWNWREGRSWPKEV
jgi:hypothetical protein